MEQLPFTGIRGISPRAAARTRMAVLATRPAGSTWWRTRRSSSGLVRMAKVSACIRSQSATQMAAVARSSSIRSPRSEPVSGGLCTPT
ncbi:hypothetical protein OG505_12235 [Micromonospora sp. NBC_00617]